MDFAADLPAMYADFGQLATRASPAGSFRMILDRPGVESLDMSSTHITAHAPASVGLEEGQALTIGGVDYLVAEPPMALADGLEVVATLRVVP